MVLIHHARIIANTIESLLWREGFEKYLIALVGSAARGKRKPRDLDILVYIPDARPDEVLKVAEKVAGEGGKYAKKIIRTGNGYARSSTSSSILHDLETLRLSAHIPIEIIVVNEKMFKGIKQRGVEPLETFVAATMARDAKILRARGVASLPGVDINVKEAIEFLAFLENIKVKPDIAKKYISLTLDALKQNRNGIS